MLTLWLAWPFPRWWCWCEICMSRAPVISPACIAAVRHHCTSVKRKGTHSGGDPEKLVQQTPNVVFLWPFSGALPFFFFFYASKTECTQRAQWLLTKHLAFVGGLDCAAKFATKERRCKLYFSTSSVAVLYLLLKLQEAQWPIGYGVGLRIKWSSVRMRAWPLRWMVGQGSLLPLSQGDAFKLPSISYLAILVKYILAKKKKV